MERREIILNVGEVVPQMKNKEKESMIRKETGKIEDSEDKLFEPTPAKKMKFHRKRVEEKRTPKDTTVAKAFARKRIYDQGLKNKRT